MLRGATDDQACLRIWDLMERAEPGTGFDRTGDIFSRGCGFRIRWGMRQGVPV